MLTEDPSLATLDPSPEDAAIETPLNEPGLDITPAAAIRRKRSFMDRIEASLARLSTRNNFWHRVFSLIWLPFAARSGLRMKRLDKSTFQAVLPFKKFNRNWYNAMAGAALVGNAEIAGGMYVFGACKGRYTVVCKQIQYKFLRPCFGPAIYRIAPREDLEPLVEANAEFNVTLEMDVVQQLPRADKLPKVREKRVGRVEVTFHVTPIEHQKRKGRKTRPCRETIRRGESENPGNAPASSAQAGTDGAES
ncbi:MAG: hypothetical protein H6811_09910 [Phycisphaeraceae bacterium]|nr:hypothetical protein [Phycisphaeraceae bacterium]